LLLTDDPHLVMYIRFNQSRLANRNSVNLLLLLLVVAKSKSNDNNYSGAQMINQN